MAAEYSSEHEGYPHNCKFCGNHFYGRKNKNYCSIKCKFNYNNRKAAGELLQIKRDILILKQNITILEQNWSLAQKGQKITMKMLISSGFVENGLQKLSYDDDNRLWRVMGIFCFFHSQKMDQVYIVDKISQPVKLTQQQSTNEIVNEK